MKKQNEQKQKERQNENVKQSLSLSGESEKQGGAGFSGVVRYSDGELQEFKELIEAKLQEARTDYELLKSALTRQHDNGTDDTSPTFKLAEDSSDVFSKEETAHLAIRQKKFIDNLQNALIRIQNKTYGICRVSGKLIAKERLRMVPHTTLSIDAKLDITS
jgi:DnaK suppressor protein